MKISIALPMIVILSSAALSQTVVSGSQSGVWTAAGSPYQVTGEIVIPSGQTLEIQPGVEVNFQGYYKFTVNGQLNAHGTEADSVFFTTDNQATGWGGIRVESDDTALLSFCRIEYGKTSGSYPDIHGGGLALLTSNATVSNCTFADNDATGEDNGMGGAVYAYNTDGTTFTNCVFLRNHAYGEGGAIKFTGDLNTEITGCEFIENNCLYGGGAISCYMVSATKMTYCLFAGNYTSYSNGGVLNTLGGGNTVYFINCTLSDNYASAGDGGAVCLAYATGYFVNTIVYDNQGMYSDDLYLDFDGNAEVYYCDLPVPSGATGTNNFLEDPQYTDPAGYDYSLLATSACIDTGTALFVLYGDTLVNMTPGQYFGTAPDVGAFEYDDGSGISESGTVPETGLTVNQVYPNPFSSTATISYELFEDSFVSVRVYDLSGREVAVLASGIESTGSRSVVWDGTKSSGQMAPTGTYMIRVETGRGSETVKAVVLR